MQRPIHSLAAGALLPLFCATGALAQSPAAVPAAPVVHDPATVRPAAPMPGDALVPGAPGVTRLVCAEAAPAPADTPAANGTAASAEISIRDPWAAHPVMIADGTERPARFFARGRTLIFDAGTDLLYLDRDHRKFTFTRSGPKGVVKRSGLCRAAG